MGNMENTVKKNRKKLINFFLSGLLSRYSCARNEGTRNVELQEKSQSTVFNEHQRV